MNRFFFLFFFFLCLTRAYSQCGSAIGMIHVSGPNAERCHTIIELLDGGYMSSSASTGGNSSGQWVISRFDTNFNLLWTQQYGTNANETGDNLLLLQTSSGNIIAAGHTLIGSLRVLSVMMLDLSGSILWNFQLPSIVSPGETAADVIDLQDSSFLLVGTTNSYSVGSSDAFAIRFDALGNILWKASYGNSGNNHFYTATLLSNGNILCAGESSNSGWIILIDIQGNILSSKNVSSNMASLFMDSILLDNGDLVLSGRVSNSSSDCLLVKLDVDLNISISKKIALGGASSFASTLCLMSDNRIAISAVTSPSYANIGSPALVVCESLGSLQVLNSVNHNLVENHSALIRGQNLIVSDDRPIQVFWSAGADEDSKILVSDACGNSPCSESLDYSEELIVLDFVDMPIQSTEIADLIPLSWTNLEYNVNLTMDCEVECNSEFNLSVPGILCSNSSYSFNPVASGNYILGSITWVINDSIVLIAPTLELSNLELGTYSLEVSVSDVNASCTSTESYSFIVSTIPELSLPSSFTFCELPAEQLQDYSNLTWRDSLGQIIFPQNIQSEGYYVVSNSNECGALETVVSVHSDSFLVPVFDSIVLCPDEEIVLNLPGNINFVYNGVYVEENIVVSPSFPHNLIAISDMGCEYDVDIHMEVPNSNFNPNVLPSSVCQDEVLTIRFEEYANEGSWIFSSEDGVNWTPEIGENTVIYATQCNVFSHTVRVLPDFECACKSWVPNAFTPDMDGNNDVWGPVFNIDPFWFSIEVYNRWGQKVYDANGYDFSFWISDYDSNGGYHQQNGVYTYVLSYQCTKDIQIVRKIGSVALIR